MDEEKEANKLIFNVPNYPSHRLVLVRLWLLDAIAVVFVALVMRRMVLRLSHLKIRSAIRLAHRITFDLNNPHSQRKKTPWRCTEETCYSHDEFFSPRKPIKSLSTPLFFHSQREPVSIPCYRCVGDLFKISANFRYLV